MEDENVETTDTAVEPDTAESVAASKTDLYDAAGSPVHAGQPGYEHAKALADLEAKRVEDLANHQITTGVVVDGVPGEGADDGFADPEGDA